MEEALKIFGALNEKVSAELDEIVEMILAEHDTYGEAIETIVYSFKSDLNMDDLLLGKIQEKMVAQATK